MTKSFLIAPAIVAGMVLFLCAAASIARAPAALAASGVANVPPTSADDARLIDFLQKRFRIGDRKQIELSPPRPGPFDGMWTRLVTVKNRGVNESATIFTDSTAKKFILGQLIDTTVDPWARIDLKAIHLNDRPVFGPDDAAVTIVEFGDFECPFCARATTVLETIADSTYKGKVRLIFKNYPLGMHPWAEEASRAAECVRLQNPAAFWDFANALYKNQGAINPKNVKSKIDEYAAQLKLDTKVIDACKNAKSTRDRIEEDKRDGLAVRVTSTPTFFVNGIPVVGFPDEKVINFVVSSEIKEKEASAASH